MRALPSTVLGPVDSPPWKRQRRFPGTTLMMHGAPARVLAQHLGRNLRITTLSRPQASEMEDSRGALCRNRRLFGTLERLRCGWARQDREGGDEPEAHVCFFKELGVPVNRIGLEAGPLSQWLHVGLTQAGFETVLLETRHVKAALSAMTVKTDRKDACGLAHLLWMGLFQRVR